MTKFIPLFFSLVASSAFAGFRMSPIVVRFSASQPTQVLTFENQGETKTPIQIEAFTRAVNEKGDEVRAKTNDFVIYPEQLVLLPKEKRNVRVTYSGSDVGDIEKAYRIVASQLPVEFAAKESKAAKVNLNFLVQYVASAYAVPAKGKAQVRVEKIDWVSPKKIELTLVNEGGIHQVLQVKKLRLKGASLFDVDAPTELQSVNLLAKSKVKIPVTLPSELKKQDLKAELELGEIPD